MAQSAASDDFLSEHQRAEDILLGNLGYGEDAQIVTVQKSSSGYCGTGKWSDGELFEFESDTDLEDLEIWALTVLTEFVKSE